MPGLEKHTPDVPGVFGNLMWVDSVDFGGSPAERRPVDTCWDVDPAPLARLLGVALDLCDGDLQQHMHEIAHDDLDGPIHIVHLLAACERAARQTGGSLPGSGWPYGSGVSRFLAVEVSGGALSGLVDELHAGGLAAATKAVRALTPSERVGVLDPLLHYWLAPITGLQIGVTDESVRLEASDE
ncbi:hypothetical protein ABN034_23070 [Actinopolymorpha sp. B11F2]|uniref:hypothetical protein n=1 Tax=Actinopolymorpha sp. B11F2 TaxID=3160862 RepID=UPI0032E4DFDC